MSIPMHALVETSYVIVNAVILDESVFCSISLVLVMSVIAIGKLDF